MIHLSTKQIQKQILAPVMQQSIEVLLLPIMDLHTAINQELQDNPLLEMKEEFPESGPLSTEKDLSERIDSLNHSQAVSLSEFFSDDEILDERPIKTEPSLEENLLQQLRMEFTDPRAVTVGEFILGNLDEDGYLTCNRLEIAENTGIDDFGYIENILKIIQEFEPLGIASRDLKECLSVQAKFRCPPAHNAVVNDIIQHYLGELGRKKYMIIARELKVSLNLVKEAAQIISTLDPRPARNNRPVDPGIFIKADITVDQNEDGQYKVRINKENLPALRINARYQKLLKHPHITEEEKEYIREKMRNALSFIKSIELRGKTIHQITQYILDKQKDFFVNGHSALVPMTLKDAAEALNRNESTISRAVNNKYMDTPQGLFPLKFFFSQGLTTGEANARISSTSIKETIKELTEMENKKAPLSDQDLHRYFEEKGLNIARRTVSKYRQALHILPAYLRKI